MRAEPIQDLKFAYARSTVDMRITMDELIQQLITKINGGGGVGGCVHM